MVTPERMTKQRADALAKKLDVDLDTGICHACLSVVSFALEEGKPSRITGELRSMTPHLWHDGLAEPALAAVRRACGLGVADDDAALFDLEHRGGSTRIARAIVRRLAAELTRRTRLEMRIEAIARERLGLAPPELN
jgi:hypothetical protein